MSKTYKVKWEIDIEADSPEDAAIQAYHIQQDYESEATVYECICDGETTTVDLDEET